MTVPTSSHTPASSNSFLTSGSTPFSQPQEHRPVATSLLSPTSSSASVASLTPMSTPTPSPVKKAFARNLEPEYLQKLQSQQFGYQPSTAPATAERLHNKVQADRQITLQWFSEVEHVFYTLSSMTLTMSRVE